jgi:hypothetical protein
MEMDFNPSTADMARAAAAMGQAATDATEWCAQPGNARNIKDAIFGLTVFELAVLHHFITVPKRRAETMSRNEENKKGPQLYELRITGKEPERNADVVELYWKARRAVCGQSDIHAEVETCSGPSYVHALFSDATLAKWERDGCNDPADAAKAVLADEKALDDLTEDVINAFALTVQNKIGQTDGGVASIYFSDSEVRDEIKNLLAIYLRHEAI